tara:strand:- start:67 stop:777 length:711 start_codon:yes stop_codon:yes gene_type:complete
MSTKAPAFQLYAQDFLTGVMDLTMEERGIYITLLCKQWSINNEKGIPKKRLRLFLGYDWETLPEMVKEKFIDNGDYFYNQRLNNTLIERIAFIKKQTFNGYKGGRPPKVKTQKKAKLTPSMKIEDRSKKIEEEKEVVVYPFNSKQFINTWSNWKIYKANEFKFNYRTLQSEQAALKKLSKESDHEAHAIESIESAMANGWKGIYPQKIITNGKQNNKNELSYSKEFQEELIRKISS